MPDTKRLAVIRSAFAFSILNRSSSYLAPNFCSAFNPPIHFKSSFPFPQKTIHKKSLHMSTFNNNDNGDSDAAKKSQFSLVHSNDVEAVRNAPKLDGKRPTKMSTSTFLFTAIVGVPIWLTFVMPLTVAYQTGKKVLTISSPDDDSVGSIQESVHHETFPETHELKPIKDRTYDIVLLGGTGFTGRLAAIYLAKNYNSNIRWAIAGRTKNKLEKLQRELKSVVGDPSAEIDMILVDTSKPESIHDLVKDSKCVITTAGPFCKYGSNVVEFCARYGTNYVDITGETGWNKDMIMKWDEKAQETGAKIVSLCGCDSIPWDMTYFKLAQMLRDDCKDSIAKVRCYDEIKGGVSGGTIDTMLTFIDGQYKEPKYSFDPYYKKVDGSKSRNKAKDLSSQFISRKKEDGSEAKWANPFVMSTVNSEVVKRSHALDDSVDGQALTYAESNVQVSFKEAFVTWFSTLFGATALLNPVTGLPMKKFLLPKPGEGPKEKDMEHGYLLVSGVGEGAKGSKVESEFYFPGDPGYRETARMVSEAGLCLALDSDKLPVQGGGFYSPSVAMGDALLERLCRTGCKFASRVVHIQDGKLHSKL